MFDVVLLDQSFRDAIKTNIENVNLCFEIVDLAIDLAMNDRLCYTNTIFVILGDLLDMAPLDKCEVVFSYIERNIQVWKKDLLYITGKTHLLRMCNDLLRRLSESRQTITCGRIQMFLARLFPLTEKSALNLMSHFNVENVTMYAKEEDVKRWDSSVDVEEGELRPLDSHLDSGKCASQYVRFWTLQDYFRSPGQCYDRTAWRRFKVYSENVFEMFDSHKLDSFRAKKRRKLSHDSVHDESDKDGGVYFTKFLTSERLFHLQVGDPAFRRHILIQFLILFQYLTGSVKFKPSSFVLSEEMSKWLTQKTECVYNLIKETPPDGNEFASSVESLLQREGDWIRWKNDSCPPFAKSLGNRLDMPTVLLAVRKTRLNVSNIDLGSPELTRLWNVNPDNLNACESKDRKFQPTLESFFENAITQNDPASGVEDEYKDVNKVDFQWRALRLLSRKSPNFFVTTTQQHQTMSHYLTHACNEMSKELQSYQPVVPFPTEELDQQGDDTEFDDEDVSNVSIVNSNHIALLAEKLNGKEWKKLAIQLDCEESDIERLENAHPDVVNQVKEMLGTWCHEFLGGKPPTSALISALNDVNLKSYAEAIRVL